jgi:hypothetical protein
MKVQDLSGAELDYWVAKATGMLRSMSGKREFRLGEFSPSTEWQHGGPIIERKKISLDYYSDSGRWCENNSFFAETPLTAAMRAFVASKFGEEVDAQAT